MEEEDFEWLGGDLFFFRCGDEFFWLWWGRLVLDGEELDVRGKEEFRGEVLGFLRGIIGFLGGVFGL